jgi:hypothetical protein
MAAVVLNQAESVRLLDDAIPAYAYPQAAAGAIARAATYGAWRAQPRGEVPAFPDVRTADARHRARVPQHGCQGRLAAARPDRRRAALLRDPGRRTHPDVR